MILIDGDDLLTIFPVDDDEPNLSHIRTVNRMAEYIRKDTARRIIDSPRNREQMLAVLDAIPSEDVQPVVRCKNCKYWDESDNHSTIHPNRRCRAVIGKIYTDSEFYCAYGERKDTSQAALLAALKERSGK